MLYKKFSKLENGYLFSLDNFISTFLRDTGYVVHICDAGCMKSAL